MGPLESGHLSPEPLAGHCQEEPCPTALTWARDGPQAPTIPTATLYIFLGFRTLNTNKPLPYMRGTIGMRPAVIATGHYIFR